MGHAGVARPRLYILCLHKTKGRENAKSEGGKLGKTMRGNAKTIQTDLVHLGVLNIRLGQKGKASVSY